MLSPTAQIIKNHTGVGPIGTGHSQCLAGKVGKGKIVVFGDSNGCTSMLFDKDKPEDSTGFNDTFYDWKHNEPKCASLVIKLTFNFKSK